MEIEIDPLDEFMAELNAPVVVGSMSEERAIVNRFISGGIYDADAHKLKVKQKQIKSRRFNYMKSVLERQDYFSLSSMKERDGELYKLYMGDTPVDEDEPNAPFRVRHCVVCTLSR